MDVLNFTCTNKTFDRFLIFEFVWNHCNDFDLRAHECVSDTVRFYFNTDAQSIDGYVNEYKPELNDITFVLLLSGQLLILCMRISVCIYICAQI